MCFTAALVSLLIGLKLHVFEKVYDELGIRLPMLTEVILGSGPIAVVLWGLTLGSSPFWPWQLWNSETKVGRRMMTLMALVSIVTIVVLVVGLYEPFFIIV